MRAYNRYHVDGRHQEPVGGPTERHFYACSWCLPQTSWDHETNRPCWSDREWEQMFLPQSMAGASLADILAYGRAR